MTFRMLKILRRTAFDVNRGLTHRGLTLDAATAQVSLGQLVPVVPIHVEAGIRCVVIVSRSVWSDHRNKIFRSGQSENVGFTSIVVLRQPLFGFSSDGRCGETPAKAKWTIAETGVVRQRKLRPKVRKPGACGYRHAHRPGAHNRTGGKFFSDTANSRRSWVGKWPTNPASARHLFAILKSPVKP